MVNKTGDTVNAKLNFYTHDVNNDRYITFDEFKQKTDFKRGYDRYRSIEYKVNLNNPSEAYVKKRIDLFNIIDFDKNFKLTLEELTEYYKDKFNENDRPINANFHFFGLDKNEDKSLELGEFASVIDIALAKKKYKAHYTKKK
jgi:hypothetical protein